MLHDTERGALAMTIKRIKAEDPGNPAAPNAQRDFGTNDVAISTPPSRNDPVLDGDLVAVLDALLAMAESE